MIPRPDIIRWRETNAPWQEDAQVEQDLILSRALVHIFSSPLLKTELRFRGGTALNKIILGNPARYSEDIDLVRSRAAPAGPVMKELRDALDSWLGKPNTSQSEGRVTFLYRFETEIAPIRKMKLKVEINTREHFHVDDIEGRKFSVSNPWFSGEAEITTYSSEELLGTKLRALYQRRKGRDLFDLDISLRTLPNLDPKKIIECFERYLGHQKLRVTRAQFEANLALKLDDSGFIGDVKSLLAPVYKFDVHAAAELINRELISKLPGEPSKKK